MHIIENPVVPFTTPIFEGFKHDSKVNIHGDSFGGHHAHFCIEFFAGADIALHIAFRFGHDHHVWINSMVGGCWHAEERHHNPIHHGEHFHLKIKNKHHHFEIKVNGHEFKFPHRISPHFINAMGIKGDIHVHKIHFEDFHHHNGGGIGAYPTGYPTGYPTQYPMPVAAPPPIGYGAPPPVVVIEEGHHHHHGLMHDLFHGHHHHHHHH
uniref:Galectin n=1 Tax=Panagrolaimus sp. JU765 TaxID=591449 RepID=A0AC34Q9G1_9BILA